MTRELYPTDGFVRKISWPDPTPEMLGRPDFDAIWNVTKHWDINVPDAYSGYCGATGNHVRAILDAIDAVHKARGASGAHEPSAAHDPSWSRKDQAESIVKSYGFHTTEARRIACAVLRFADATRQTEAPEGWQPIESAPKDGTEVLLTGFMHNEPEQGRWQAVGGWSDEASDWVQDSEDPDVVLNPPTHWQPLPAPPTAEGLE